jgi:hypothetical protein
MPKKYKVRVDSDVHSVGELTLYAGQIWITDGLSKYRKITKITDKEKNRLFLSYKDKDGEKGASCDIDDMVLWVLQNGAKPLLIDYEGSDELEQ